MQVRHGETKQTPIATMPVPGATRRMNSDSLPPPPRLKNRNADDARRDHTVINPTAANAASQLNNTIGSAPSTAPTAITTSPIKDWTSDPPTGAPRPRRTRPHAAGRTASRDRANT